MPTYFVLINWTDQGIKNVKESPKRVDAAKKSVKDAGGDVKSFYMLQGKYDAVLIMEMPNDETLAKFLLKIGTLGNVRTTTMRAYPETEYRKIIDELG
jgi:uncharacterized protein with GYD domain